MGYNKLITITTCIVAALAVTVYQMIHPQALLTSLVSVFVIIGAYLNMENPLLQKPGKLTAEEFDVMKTHAAKGGEIIKETFQS